MSVKAAFISSVLMLVLCGCDPQALKIEAIDSQSKTLLCSLNASSLKIEIAKGSLDASLFLGEREIKVNLLEVKDFYQILMRFDPNIGQLKINKAGTELIQLRESQERTESCTMQLRSIS